jgi:hypothetical protein
VGLAPLSYLGISQTIHIVPPTQLQTDLNARESGVKAILPHSEGFADLIAFKQLLFAHAQKKVLILCTIVVII